MDNRPDRKKIEGNTLGQRKQITNPKKRSADKKNIKYAEKVWITGGYHIYVYMYIYIYLFFIYLFIYATPPT